MPMTWGAVTTWSGSVSVPGVFWLMNWTVPSCATVSAWPGSTPVRFDGQVTIWLELFARRLRPHARVSEPALVVMREGGRLNEPATIERFGPVGTVTWAVTDVPWT